MWHEWWVWIAAGVVLAILEVLVSGYVLLGFAAGAVLTGLLLVIGVLGGSLATLILVFAIASLLAWFAFSRLFGLNRDGARIIHHDINEN